MLLNILFLCLFYNKLYPSYSAFTWQLSSAEIPKNVQDALWVLSEKRLFLEEMLLKKWDMEVGGYTKGKKPVGCKQVFTTKFI